MKFLFIHENSPSHLSKLTFEFFEHKRFTEEKIMKWPPSSFALNLVENLWSTTKIKLYESGKQGKSKADLWEAIQTIMMKIEPADLRKLTKSIDERLLVVIEKDNYIKM